MVNPARPAARAWSQAFSQPGRPFEPQPLTLLEGKIPPEIQGTFYQNGAARFRRNGAAVGHWFDGDGAILRVSFEAGQAQACYRYVQTAGYRAEHQADRFLKGGYGMLAPQPWWRRIGSPLSQAIKNTANTAVLALPDRLLALWEADRPHALDLETLETRGQDDLGSLGAGQGYSAHPKRDPKTGDIFNFGLEAGPVTRLHLYRSDASGQIRQRAAYALDGVPLIHDMVLAGRYLVFCISPVRLDLVPALLQLRSFSDCLRWHPQRATEIWVFDCDRLERISRSQAPAWFQWHFANGFVQQGEIVLQLVRYSDFRSNALLGEIPRGHLSETLDGQLWELRIDPRTAALGEQTCLYDRTCEFPAVMPQEVGQEARTIFFAAHRPQGEIEGELMGSLVGIEPRTGGRSQFDFGPHRYLSSPVCLPHPTEPGQGWVITTVFHGSGSFNGSGAVAGSGQGNRQAQHQAPSEKSETTSGPSSEIWIFQSSAIERGAIAKLALPCPIPFGFHGTWAAKP